MEMQKIKLYCGKWITMQIWILKNELIVQENLLIIINRIIFLPIGNFPISKIFKFTIQNHKVITKL